MHGIGACEDNGCGQSTFQDAYLSSCVMAPMRVVRITVRQGIHNIPKCAAVILALAFFRSHRRPKQEASMPNLPARFYRGDKAQEHYYKVKDFHHYGFGSLVSEPIYY